MEQYRGVQGDAQARAQTKALVSAELPTKLPLRPPPRPPPSPLPSPRGLGGDDDVIEEEVVSWRWRRRRRRRCCPWEAFLQRRQHTPANAADEVEHGGGEGTPAASLDGGDSDIFSDVPLYDDDELVGRDARCELACAPLILAANRVYIGTTTRACVTMNPLGARCPEMSIHAFIPASAVGVGTIFRCAGKAFAPLAFEPYTPRRDEIFTNRYSITWEHASNERQAGAFSRTLQFPLSWTDARYVRPHDYKVCLTSAHNFEVLCRSLSRRNAVTPSLIVVGGVTEVLVKLIHTHRVRLRRQLREHKIPQNMQALVHFALASIFDPAKDCIMYVCQETPVCLAPVDLVRVETALRVCLLPAKIDRWRYKYLGSHKVLDRAPCHVVNDCTSYLSTYLEPFYPRATGAKKVLAAKRIILIDRPPHEIFSPAEFRHRECDGVTIAAFHGGCNEVRSYFLEVPSVTERRVHVAAQKARFDATMASTWRGRIARTVDLIACGRGKSTGGSATARAHSTIKQNVWAWECAAVETDAYKSNPTDDGDAATKDYARISVFHVQTRAPSGWRRHPHAYIPFIPWFTRDYSAVAPYIFV